MMSIKVRRFDFDIFWKQIPRRAIECLGFDYEHQNGFIGAYFLYSPSEIFEYVEAVSVARKHYCHDIDLSDKGWRLNYDDEDLKGLSEVEARKNIKMTISRK